MKKLFYLAIVFSLFCVAGPSYGIGVSELADKLAASKGVSKEQAKGDISAVFNLIQSELETGESVSIRNFGRFSIKERGPRKARNPRTGEEIQVEARKYPRFKASDTLKRVVNEK